MRKLYTLLSKLAATGALLFVCATDTWLVTVDKFLTLASPRHLSLNLGVLISQTIKDIIFNKYTGGKNRHLLPILPETAAAVGVTMVN